jgi:hypothetical protein
MTKSDGDPPRLREDRSASLAMTAALRAEAADGPSHAQIARMSAALGLALPPASSPPPAAPIAASSAASGAGLASWVGLSGIGIAIVATAALVVWTRSPRAAEPRPARTRTMEAASAPAPQIAEAPVEAPVLAPAPIEVAPVRRRVRRARVQAPAADAPVVPTPVATPINDGEARLREETALVQRAEGWLARDPSAALRLANEHRQRFARGILSEEREVVAIDALLRLGRRDAAEQRAQLFFASHEGSLHARRIRRLLE